MQYPLYSTVRAGREYSRQWPTKAELNGLFPENKVIRLTELAFRYIPLLALVVACLQFTLLGETFLPQILAMMLFLASLPFQGWYWLGVRAATPLPPAMISWYKQIRQQMQQHGIVLAPASHPYRYRDLAQLLKQAYQQLDKTFIRNWF